MFKLGRGGDLLARLFWLLAISGSCRAAVDEDLIKKVPVRTRLAAALCRVWIAHTSCLFAVCVRWWSAGSRGLTGPYRVGNGAAT